MKIENLSEKLLAGTLGTVILCGSIHLVAYGVNASNNSSNQNVQEQLSDFEFSFADAKNLKIISLESKGKNSTLLVAKKTGLYFRQFGKGTFNYYCDLNSGNVFDESEIKITKEENLEDYLFAYDYIQSNYSTQELNSFFEKIKQNYYTDQKDKVKVR